MSLVDIPDCPYCSEASKLVSGIEIYPHRMDLAHKPFFACLPCKAWVGCHDGTHRPLGRLANAELRRAKEAAHAAFDPLWKRKARVQKLAPRAARAAGYAWLAQMLNVPREDCHIGMFDVETCRRVVEICRNPKKPTQPQPDLLEGR